MREKIKKAGSIFIIFMLCLLASPLTVFAGNINTVSAVAAGGSVTVSGTTETGVLAVAFMVYDSSNNLVAMETGAVDGGSYNQKLTHTFANGTYTIKTADYAGGDFKTTTVKVTSPPPSPNGGTGTTNPTKSPKTGDQTMTALLAMMVLLSGCVTGKLLVKKI